MLDKAFFLLYYNNVKRGEKMLYLVLDPYDEIVGRFLSLDRAVAYRRERNDGSSIKAVTFEEYEEMKRNFLKSA